MQQIGLKFLDLDLNSNILQTTDDQKHLSAIIIL